MKAVIGLGNPGKTYESTRHNVGFRVVQQVAQDLGISLSRKGFKALFGLGILNTETILLAEPLTYMNLSGEAIQLLIAEFHILPSNLIITHDDVDLELGRIRIKKKGGDGGHKGIRSIIEYLGTDEFLRVKIGIGRPDAALEVADHVLSPFNPGEVEKFKNILPKVVEAIKLLILSEVDKAMTLYNKKEL